MRKLLTLFVLLTLPGCFKEKQNSDKKVKVIVFDFDGTLANTLPLAVKCINFLAPEYGYKPIDSDAATIEIFREKSMHEIVKALGLWFYQLPGYTTKAKNFFKEHLNEVTVFDDIKEMIVNLSVNYELAVISSNSQDAVKYALANAGITEIKTICSDSSIFGKHTVIKRFLKNNNLTPCEMIYVADEIRDIEACKKVGVKIIAVTWGYNSKDALSLSKPDYIADTCQDVIKILNTI